MIYRLLADIILLLHLLFVLFVALGGVLVLWRRYMFLLHLPAVFWAARIEFSGAFCPLTPLENWLRRLGGQTGYEGGFIQHYIDMLLYPPGLTRPLQTALGAGLLLINGSLYGLLLYRIWQEKRSA